MDRSAKIYVAGHRGLVGSAIIRKLQAEGHMNLVLRKSSELDLRNQTAVADFFRQEKPEYVFLAAAKVGGIHANNTFPAEFIYENLMMQCNVIHSAYLANVRRLLFLGSSCIYPKFAPQPMNENYLLSGVLEPTNEPYALAKIAGIKMCESYNRQYGTQFIAVMPTNLFGPQDNFHPENSHVLPALIRRFHEAKAVNVPEVVVWGSGKPMREFLYVDDMADCCFFVMNLEKELLRTHFLDYPKDCFVNLGTGADVTIQELAETVKEVVGYNGKLVFDPSKPDGTPRKLLDVAQMKSLGWQAKVCLREGIERTYQWFLENIENLRH